MSSLPQIEAFLTVARAGSFAAAAARLSAPRSTISARVAALETRLGVRLLTRTTRRLALTEEGRRYREGCEAALMALEEAEAAIADGGITAGTIRLTVPVDMSMRRLSAVLGRFQQEHPRIRFDVLVTDEAVDLVTHNIDVALRGRAPGAPGLVARKLGEAPLGAFAVPGHAALREADGGPVDASYHVVFDPAERLGKRSATGLSTAPVVGRNFEIAKACALDGRGIALIPRGLCEEEVSTGLLREIALSQPLGALPLYLMLPSRLQIPLRVRAFCDFLARTDIRPLLL